MKSNRNINGAIYLPTSAYNAYQMWKEYDPEIIERDLSYAQKINLNAIRVWFSYEYWLEDKKTIKSYYEHLLNTAQDKGILVMPSLFEKVGVEPTKEALNNKNPLNAYCVFSPATEIFTNPGRYSDTAEYIKWFMNNYKHDSRHLAIEVMNEPYGEMRIKFAREMLKVAQEYKGINPLTIGTINMEHSMYFMDIGLDIIQHHNNFPTSKKEAENRLQLIREASEILDKPVWLTEWQRLRSTSGWEDEKLTQKDKEPDYAPYAELINEYPDVGTFFWSLMVKPAYLAPQRRKGTINGLFHEDGAVWNLEDARTIANDSELELEERQEWPEGTEIIAEHYSD